MRKKIIFLLILFSFLFITTVHAEQLGDVNNPGSVTKGEYYNVPSSQMVETLYNSSFRYKYYAFKITIDKFSYFYCTVDSPVLKENSDDPYFFAEIDGISTNFDDLNIIRGIYEEVLPKSEKYTFSYPVAPGDYYIVVGVELGDYDNNEYTIGFKYNTVYAPLEMEPNDTIDEANSMELNVMHGSSIDSSGTPDYYSFKPIVGRKTRIYVDTYATTILENLSISVYDELFVETFGEIPVHEMEYDPSRNQYYYDFTPTKDRIYYLKVSGPEQTNQYQIGIYQTGTTDSFMIDAVDFIDTVYGNEDEDIAYVYRLYNKYTSEHLYTTDANEVKVLFSNYGWGFEGVGWLAYTDGTPVYRLYNPGLSNHLYTSDENEVNELTKNHGWVKDNDGKPVMYSNYDGGDGIPIYRVYNEGLSGMHHLTTDDDEYDALPEYGWEQEGISMYAYSEGEAVATEYYNVNF